MRLSVRELEVREHGNAEDDTVPAEHLEVVALDERHEHTDDEQGRNERSHHADGEDDKLGLGENKAELDELEQTRAEHDRDSEEERELRRHRARNAEQQCTDDGRAGARGAGKTAAIS